MVTDQLAVVTGAASPAGIGFAIAQELARQGASVIISDAPGSEDRLAESLEKLRADYPTAGKCTMDVSNPRSVEAAFAKISSEYGEAHILVNNAGVGGGSSEFLALDDSDFRSALDVNLMGAVNCCRAVLPHMQDNRRGAIINIASLCGLGAIPEIPASYTASKFAVRALTQCWQAELRPFNIRVCQLNPSEVTTAFYNEERQERAEVYNKLSPKEIAHSILSVLEMEDKGFITELNVWATNPF